MEKWFADDIRENLCRIEESIAEACVRAGRRREEVTLVGVTKTVDAERVNAALAAGLTVGGKAIGKSFAVNSCTAIVHTVGKLVHALKGFPDYSRKKKKK